MHGEFKSLVFSMYRLWEFGYRNRVSGSRASLGSTVRTGPCNCVYTEVCCAMSQGPTSTFEHLALPLLPSLYSHAFWLTRNHAEAEDLAQEAISKALRAFASFEPGTNFKAWIFRSCAMRISHRAPASPRRAQYLSKITPKYWMRQASRPRRKTHSSNSITRRLSDAALDQLQACTAGNNSALRC